jgi:hypothetical protein
MNEFRQGDYEGGSNAALFIFPALALEGSIRCALVTLRATIYSTDDRCT